MKNKYLKPDAEYISFEAENIITDIPGMNGGVASGSALGDDEE